MDKLGSKPLSQLTEAELRVELQQTRNALIDVRQQLKDSQGAMEALTAVQEAPNELPKERQRQWQRTGPTP